ncbi:YckD family protein [Schnuerera sp. xch1]|uniref:YckD family protein n=1 Tax=Schnuerera sp. xch1 TaxID=2874283 RepID=UPI001CBA85E5|nr:YckD family protein [Schnuerera sp. xch1]MBZ2175551.1 YckD family protein [Schnuerera sp. xch1]
MKKVLTVLSLVLVVGLTATFAYAETSETTQNVDEESWTEWFEEKMEWKKSQIEEALDEGLITEEEAENLYDHFDYMEEFHNEDGFMPGKGFYGRRNGFGRGMMRGCRW